MTELGGSRWISPVAASMLEALYGAAAKGWLAELDALVGELCGRWQLVPLGVLPGAGASAVVQVWSRREQRLAVLKLAPPMAKLHEAALAFTAWQDTAARHGLETPFPAVWAVEDAASAQLLEWVPAATAGRFTAVPQPDELGCIGAVLELVARTSGQALAPIELEWLVRRGVELTLMAGMRELTSVEAAQVALAARTHALACEALGELQGDVQGDRLVHADLWFPNVLVSPRRWVVIDPWPAQGEPAMDLGQWAATANDGNGAEARCAALADAAECSVERAWDWTAERAALRVLLIVSHELDEAPLAGLAGVCTRWLADREAG